jgi:hypothetical protein
MAMTPDTSSTVAGLAAAAGQDPRLPTDLRDLMEQARQALAARLSGQAGAGGVSASGPSDGDAGGRRGGLVVTLAVDEGTRRPVIRVWDGSTGRPVRDVPPGVLLPRRAGART